MAGAHLAFLFAVACAEREEGRSVRSEVAEGCRRMRDIVRNR